MTENERLVKMLIDLRKHNNLTQEEMADKVGMLRSNYSRLESGKHEIRTVKIAQILDVFGLEIGYVKKK